MKDQKPLIIPLLYGIEQYKDTNNYQPDKKRHVTNLMLIVLILNWFPALTPTMPRVYSDGRTKRAVLSWTRRMYERRSFSGRKDLATRAVTAEGIDAYLSRMRLTLIAGTPVSSPKRSKSVLHGCPLAA